MNDVENSQHREESELKTIISINFFYLIVMNIQVMLNRHDDLKTFKYYNKKNVLICIVTII